MLIPVATMLAMLIAAEGAVAGVAAASQDGRICVAMPAPALTPGATLTLVQPDRPQSALVVTVDRNVTACEPLERALISGPFYSVQRPASSTAAPGTVWVALAGTLETRRAGTGAIAVRLGPAYPAARIRSCTSREGLHLTVWSGTPLTSRRLWHQYYYLGYDVDPSCDNRDFRDSDR
jgi:hypothetical protein